MISAFDGVGSLRLALDLLNAPVAGYIAIERNPQARRVVESAFPSCIFIEDITTVGKAEVMSWAARFPNCAMVIFAEGPPCQGVSSLNFTKLGADRDPRSSLYQNFVVWVSWCKRHFPGVQLIPSWKVFLVCPQKIGLAFLLVYSFSLI